MLAAFLEALPIALGTVLATLPLVAISLLLATGPRKAGFFSFLGGWLTGAMALGIAVMLISDVSAPGEGPPRPWVLLLRLFLGVALISFALRKWLRRPDAGSQTEMPGWMTAVETMRPAKVFALGIALVVLSPKNAALFASGALTIAAAIYAPVSQVIVLAGFVAVASIGVAVPLLISLVLGKRSEAVLVTLKDLIIRHSATIVAVVLGVIGLIVMVNAERALSIALHEAG